VKHLVLAAGLAGCLALAACQQPKQEAIPLVAGSTDIVVHSSRMFTADIGTTLSSQAFYIVCTLTFTNDTGHDASPEPKNFVLQDQLGQSYVGVDSGAAALVGISNYAGVVKKDAHQDYTIGFRVPSNTRGTVFYSAL
jgi:hypothetical protein